MAMRVGLEFNCTLERAVGRRSGLEYSASRDSTRWARCGLRKADYLVLSRRTWRGFLRTTLVLLS